MKRFFVITLFLGIVAAGFNIPIEPIPYPFPQLPFFPKMPTASDNAVTMEGARLGKRLFYDPILSSDSSLSCSSCHQHEHAFSDSSALSKGRNGALTSRNTMPLFNLAWYPAYFWDGRANSLENQVFHPVRAYNEMNLDWKTASNRIAHQASYQKQFAEAFGDLPIDSIQISKAIAQFMRTLLSYQSKFDLVFQGKKRFTKDEYDGYVIANEQNKGGCIHCHITDGAMLSTTLHFSNNGLDSPNSNLQFSDNGRGSYTGHEADNGKFMIPSLRNLAFTAPYMHDGRFKTLEEVIDFYSTGVHSSPTTDSKMTHAKQGGVHLSSEEKRKLIAFLLTLSDSTFIENPEFKKE